MKSFIIKSTTAAGKTLAAYDVTKIAFAAPAGDRDIRLIIDGVDTRWSLFDTANRDRCFKEIVELMEKASNGYMV